MQSLDDPRPAAADTFHDSTAAVAESLIPRAKLASRLGVSESTTRNMEAAGVLAAPVRISPRRVGWRESYVNQLIRSLPKVRA